MSEIISDDSRRLLIDTFFAVIITLGFAGFLLHFGLETNFSKISADIETLFNMLFFFSAYFWVISHWIFYHELIKKYPYYRWRKFFVDIALFSLMFVILDISSTVYSKNNSILYLFILLIAAWYALACLWHMADKEVRSTRRYLRAHAERFITYLSLFVVLLCLSLIDPLSVYHKYGEFIREGIMVSTIAAMIIFNVTRLDRFISRRDISSQCCLFCYDDKLAEFPECYLPQIFSRQLIEICNKTSSKTWWNEIVNHSPYQIKNDSVKKRLSTQLIEFLILLWISHVTSHQEKELTGFKNRDVPLTEIKSRPKGGNIFLELLPTLETSKGSDKTIIEASIRLPADIKEIKFCQHDVHKHNNDDAGMVLLEGRYFDIEIKYNRQKNFSHSACVMPSGLAWPSKEGVSINPTSLNNQGIDKLRNTHIVTYKLEFYTSLNMMACLRSFSKSVAKEISWLSNTAETFNEFDINTYIVNLEKIARFGGKKSFEKTIASELHPSNFVHE